MFFENLTAEWINLNLPPADHPGPLKAQIQAANTGEERTKRHRSTASGRRVSAVIACPTMLLVPTKWSVTHHRSPPPLSERTSETSASPAPSPR